MKKLREHRTPLRPLAARINSAPSLFNSSQVASDSTAYRSGEKKDTTEEDRERTFTV